MTVRLLVVLLLLLGPGPPVFLAVAGELPWHLALTVGAAMLTGWLLLLVTLRRVLMAPLADLHQRAADLLKIHDAQANEIPPDPAEAIGKIAHTLDLLNSRLQENILRAATWETILDGMPESLIVLSPGGEIRFVNQATCELLGYGKEELQGRDIDLIMAGGLFGHTPGAVQSRWLGAKISCEYQTKIGGGIPMELACSSLRDNAGELSGIVCCATDLRRQHTVEQALRQSELMLGSVFDAIPDPLAVRDRDLHILLSNRHDDETSPAGHRTGLIRDSCHQQMDPSCSPCLVREVFASGKPQRREKHDPLDGATREYNAYPVFDVDGSVVMAIEHIHDISVRIAAERKLRDSEQRFQLFMDNVPGAVFIWNENGRILFANRFAREELSLGAPDMENGHPGEITALPLLANWKNPLTEDVQAAVVSLTDRNDRLRSFSLYRFPLRHEQDQNLAGAIALDITEQKLLETQLQQSQKLEAIGTLAGGIAHDFNNILGAILGYAELIRLHTAEGLVAQDLDEIVVAAKRAAELVRQILSFSRHAEEEARPVQVRFVVKEALKLLRSTLPSSIEIIQDISPDLSPVLADPTRIHQVLMNLCTNAKQAMRDQKGILRVALHEREVDDPLRLGCPHIAPGAYLDLEVSDTGCGMEPQLLRRIFDPFFTTKEKGQGTGLGLSVVHGIVTRLAGGITVSSQPGQGSTFHVLLPVIAGDDAAGGSEANVGTNILQGEGTILLVEDEVNLARLMEKILVGLGYRVTTCTDSLRAWKVFQDNHREFDLVFTDMTMPGLNGAELSQRILKLSPKKPIVLCTGFNELINEEQAKRLGIRAYLKKPVPIEQLARTLHEVLRS